ncbi:MAG: MFS transporter [Sphaerochaetaceae bacterium]|nr:MFS transporter [Sphaerochaetaceae bacterium]
MKNKNYIGFLWHAIFLSLTTTFTEVNTVIPALILSLGGSSFHVGVVSAIFIGLPVVTKLFFSSFLSSKNKKKPYLLLGINLRVLALISIAVTLIYYKSFSFIVILLLLYFELLVFSVGGAFASLPYVYLLGSLSKDLRINFFTRRQMISSVGMLLSVIIARYILSTWQYPTQYVILFSISATSLFIASMGFWQVKESSANVSERVYLKDILKNLPSLLKHDKNFALFLIYSNIMGAALALTPFYIGYAKNNFTLDGKLLSSLLLIQISGMFVASFLYPKIINKKGFKGVLKFRIYIHFFLPLIAVYIANKGSLIAYLFVFFFIGVIISARAVSEDAALIELSNESNRVIYSALSGTLNIAIIVVPLILGSLISVFSYEIIFIISSLFTLLAFPILSKITCPIDLETN